MAVRIGSARMDENGRLHGGKAGDQTGKEVSTQNWYLHSQGWRVFKAKDPAKAEKIAQDMEWACENPNIGYDQYQNQTLYQAAKPYKFNCKKVKVKCETDCSHLVRVCVLYAGIDVAEFSTASEPAALLATGAFTELKDDKYTRSSLYLERGMILVTKGKGHTVIVLTDGSKVVKTAPAAPSNDGVAAAQNYNESLAGTYAVTTALNLRKAPEDGDVITVMKKNDLVHCYGFYTQGDRVKWLLVKYGKTVGFCSNKYLQRK